VDSDGGFEQPASSLENAVSVERHQPTRSERMLAFFEVLICSDYPTQLALGSSLTLIGFRPQAIGGGLDIGYVVALSLTDTVALIGLIVVFLTAHGESARHVLLGSRPIAREIAAGIPLSLASLALAIGVLAGIQLLAPALHTVAHNPLQDLVQTRRDAFLFGLVVVVAGGVREEIQRAFLLHRFEHWLGGGGFGLIVVSAVFGAGHLLQGVDAAITTGLLGLLWGVVYLRRRSVVAPVVSHSGFNLLQLAQFLAMRR
jgi:membrane protease YdiL (CAAX protease family)